MIVQDSVPEIRHTIIDKVFEQLMKGKLPLQYVCMLTLAATSDDKETVTTARRHLTTHTKTRRQALERRGVKNAAVSALPEYAMVYLIHLLAHHPDFSPANLRDFQKYIKFFLDTLADKSEHFLFLHQVVLTIKQTVDAREPPKSENIYTLCDLALAVIQHKAQTSQWALKEYPGEIVLPASLYANPETPVRHKGSYLPANFAIEGGGTAASPISRRVAPPPSEKDAPAAPDMSQAAPKRRSRETAKNGNVSDSESDSDGDYRGSHAAARGRALQPAKKVDSTPQSDDDDAVSEQPRPKRVRRGDAPSDNAVAVASPAAKRGSKRPREAVDENTDNGDVEVAPVRASPRAKRAALATRSAASPKSPESQQSPKAAADEDAEEEADEDDRPKITRRTSRRRV
eukprot:Opistho-2@36196